MKRLLLLVAVMLLIASLGVLPASAQSSLPAGPVYDNGPSWHARGTVSGNVYTVAFGDTMFSISRRFGLTVDGLAAANGITNTSLIFGGQSLTIPGLGPGPTPGPTSNITISTPTAGALLPASFTVSGNASGPSGANVVVQALLNTGAVLAQQVTTLGAQNAAAGGLCTWSVQLTVLVAAGTQGTVVSVHTWDSRARASVTVVYGQTIPTAFITITSPTSGTVLPASFTVSGNAAGLTQGNLVVQALAGSGAVLAQQPTTLQGPNVGTGGPGTWSVQLTISVPAGTPGTIVAFAPNTSVRASLPVIYGQSTPTAFVTITSPPPGSVLPASFTVSGNGAGLFEGTVVVRALTNSGAILAEEPTMLQGANVGSGGQGTWSVPLTVTVAAGTPGAIVAFAPGTTIQASVSVVYGSASSPYKVFLPGQCQIQVAPGTPFYLYPTGPQIGQFGVGGSLNAIAGFKVNDQPWYQVNPQAGQNSPPYWVPGASTTTAGPGCAW